MVVLTLLHPPTAKLFGVALSPHSTIIVAATALGFSTSLGRERIDLAVVDPSVDAEDSVNRLGSNPMVRALSAASAPPFVLYISDGRAVALRAALVRLGPAMVAVRGIDDHPERLRMVVEQTTASRLPDQLLSAVADRLAPLRPLVRDALARAVRAPLECDSVEILASAAGTSSRTLTRVLTDAGLASPRAWLTVGRVLRAHWELRDPDVKIRDVVATMGYSSDEPLANDVASITRLTPSELRHLSGERLVAIAAERLTSNAAIDSAQLEPAHGVAGFAPTVQASNVELALAD